MTNIEKVMLTYIVAETYADRQRAVQEAKEILSLMNNSPPSCEPTPAISEDAVVDVIQAVLLDIGVPCHIKGYNYLTMAICLAVKNPDIIEAITKELYPTIAKPWNTTPSRVERAIRHAIEVVWNTCDPENFMGYFGNSISMNKGKPTNAQFISTVAQKVRSLISR